MRDEVFRRFLSKLGLDPRLEGELPKAYEASVIVGVIGMACLQHKWKPKYLVCTANEVFAVLVHPAGVVASVEFVYDVEDDRRTLNCTLSSAEASPATAQNM